MEYNWVAYLWGAWRCTLCLCSVRVWVLLSLATAQLTSAASHPNLNLDQRILSMVKEFMQAVYSQNQSMLRGNMHFDTNTYTHVNTRRTEIAQWSNVIHKTYASDRKDYWFYRTLHRLLTVHPLKGRNRVLSLTHTICSVHAVYYN